MAKEDELINVEELDTIEVPDEEEGVTFTDNPTPAPEPPVEEDPAPTKKEEGQEEEDDPARSKYNKKKDPEYRIRQLTGRAKTAEERAAAAEARNAELEEAMQELAKRQASEREQTFSTREEQLKADIDAALKEGDLASYHKHNDELNNIRIERVKVSAPVATPPKAAPAPAAKPASRNPSADKWLERNSWYFEPEYAKKAQRAEEIERQLLAEGMEYGEELYEALDERLKPTPAAKPSVETPDHITPSTNGGQPTTPPKPKPGQLTQHDIKVMRRFNLDPNDAKQRAAYLKRKVK